MTKASLETHLAQKLPITGILSGGLGWIFTAVRRERQLGRESCNFTFSSSFFFFGLFRSTAVITLWKLLNTYDFCPMTFAEQLATFANRLLPSN